MVNKIFGEVREDRVIVYRKKSWFSKGSREDLPLKHVTSVRVETDRSIGKGLLMCFIGLPLLLAFGLGIIFIVMGVFMILGSPRVVVNTAGGDKAEMVGFFWQKSEAEAFASSLREKLFQN